MPPRNAKKRPKNKRCVRQILVLLPCLAITPGFNSVLVPFLPRRRDTPFYIVLAMAGCGMASPSPASPGTFEGVPLVAGIGC